MMQEWFKKAKLGIFLHWGIYAVQGLSASWAFGNGQMSYNDYMKQCDSFTASKYDPKKWAELFKKAGARYAVLTSKHHDGVALFDTKYTDLNVVKKTPAGRDLIAPYCDALREAGLKVGVYFTNTDWSDMDNMKVILKKSAEEIEELHTRPYNYQQAWTDRGMEDRKLAPDELDITDEDRECWAAFMERYQGELQELLTNYGGIDLMWFDVLLSRKGLSWDCDKTKAMIQELSPGTIVNGRLGGYGDYETPECYIPLRSLDGPWELCCKFNGSWGYCEFDKNYKTVKQVIRILVECISKGGNLLISAGPTPEGEIPPEQVKLLCEMGEWTSKYEEAVYPTEKGIPTEYFPGGSTLTEDKKTLYLFCYDKPQECIMLKGIRSKIKKVTAMKNGRQLRYSSEGGAPWLNMPGNIWIKLEDEDTDDVCTVFKVEFEDAIDLVPLHDKVDSVGGN